MTWTSVSPWDGQPVWRGVEEDPHPASAGLTGLADVPARRAALERFAAVLTARRAEAVDLLIREAGKVRADAEAEADLLPAKIAVTLDAGWRRCPPEPQDGIHWRPRGLAVVLGPYNFPLHLLHGLVVPALAMGNPVVAKPSERTPALGAWYRQAAQDAGLAPHLGVVLGGAAVAAALVADLRVATVAAVGGRAMGQALSRALADRPEVVLALELGGIGHALICDDASVAAAAPVLAEGAWRMAGQRCNATRIVHVPRQRLGEFQEALEQERRRWMPGTDPAGLAGPMIDVGQRDRFLAGVASFAPGQACHHAAVEPILAVATGWSANLQREHFGPLLVLLPYDQDASALERLVANPYRLSATVWTPDPTRFDHWAARLPYGLVGWNRSTSGARADRPFGGCGLSGNGHPAGVAAVSIFADETVRW